MLAIRRVLNNPNRCQDVIARRLIFCENALRASTEDLLVKCWCCQRFLAFCCSCSSKQIVQEEEARREYYSHISDEDTAPRRPCHYYKVALVDGACLGNGQDGAMAGIGIVVGEDPLTMHWAIPVDHAIDPSAVRTSQRAELLAALHGIYKLSESETRPKDNPTNTREEDSHSNDKVTWVITSDSEYVVLGMTEWVPSWKRNGWRNASGRRPKNLDLFQRLDAAIDSYEREYGVRIAFWRISRDYNELADGLAGFAAKGHTVEPAHWQFEVEFDSDDEMATN